MSLPHRERWANNFHLAGAVQFLIGREVGNLCGLLKEGFHFASRLEANEYFPRRFADVRPDVRHLPWREQRIARSQAHPLLSDFEDVFALHHIEPFFLSMMQMTRRTSFTQAGVRRGTARRWCPVRKPCTQSGSPPRSSASF